MAEISEYLAMGGYAGYVWPAYAIALLVIGGLVIASVRSLDARRREVAAAEGARPRRARRRPAEGSDVA